MKKNIKAFALVGVLMCVVSDAMANPIVVTAAVNSAAAATQERKKKSSTDDSCISRLEGERFVIIAVNVYAQKMTAWDKLSGNIFNFNYNSEGRSPEGCVRSWDRHCDGSAAKAVMDDVFGVYGTSHD